MEFDPEDIELIEKTYGLPSNNSKPLPPDFIINLSKASIPISKSDVLLSIIEIIQHYKVYNNRYKPSQKIFWYQCFKSPLLSPLLSRFSISSMRYITSLIQIKIPQCDQLVALIQSNKDLINESHFDSITKIVGLIKLLKPKNSGKTYNGVLIETVHKLKLKPLSFTIKKLIRKNARDIKQNKQIGHKPLVNRGEEDVFINKGYPKKHIYPVILNKRKKEIYQSIDQIISSLQSQFPNVNKRKIINALENNSMNIAKTYHMLKDTENKSKDHGFNSLHDYIIKRMEGTDIYNELIKLKGEESINERKAFLEIKQRNYSLT